MDNRYTIINDLVTQACDRLRKMGLSIDAGDVDKMVRELYSRDLSVAQIGQQVAEMEKSRRTQFEVQEALSKGLEVARNLQNLDVQHMGITLNIQDIDLMMIANAKDFEELEDAMSKVTNISMPTVLENESFIEYRQRVYDSYIGYLSHENDALKDKRLPLRRKLEHLASSGVVSREEMAIINRIISENSSKGYDAIFSALGDEFGEEKVHELLLTIREVVPISKEGITDTTLAASQELYRQLGYYDSITIDEEAKYGNVMLQDGTFNSKHLVKTLDFARSMGKTVRINTLVFYMDCPEEIYRMEEGANATRYAKEKLEYYVDEATKLFAQYPDVVRSVDVFNELLNRHPLGGDVPYMLRGDIPQDLEGESFDNIKSGWLKHLSVEDICDVLATARGNLPNVDFMYNDDHLIDPAKLEATVELIKRIQEHEKVLGVKLIDSIGTQMHIDNNVSKEQIRNMFIELSKLGLPIEVTEFDLAMTAEMEGLTPEQIEVVRQKKINEVYEVISELREECNIRGFTIWSKTDSQNFRVKLANEILVERGMEPTVRTFHGGFYTESMVPKSVEMAKKIRMQNFNYHGHTSRCGHASSVDEQAYVDAARDAGISRIGFSDHVPTSVLEDWQMGHRMHDSEVDEYISAIQKVRKDNPDMEIRCGFEAEYSPVSLGYLVELREQCDYMILGQHYVQDGLKKVSSKDNPDYPLIYAASVCEALDTGIFDMIAHPDFFMSEREKFSTEEGKVLFMENARKASYMICQKAKELGIPIELNARGVEAYLGGVRDSNGNRVHRGSDGHGAYPHPLFWEVAREVGVEVVYGVDAHDPSHLMEIDEGRERIQEQVDTNGLMFAANDYDPVIARSRNTALQEAYEETKSKAVTQDTAMIEALLSSVELSEGEDVRVRLDERLAETSTMLDESCSRTLSDIDRKIEMIVASDKPEDKKQAALELYRLRRERVIESDGERHRLIDSARSSVSEACEMGCSTKEEYIRTISLMSEARSQGDPIKMANASSELSEIKESKKSQKSEDSTASVDKPKVYTYTPSSDGGNNGSSGNGGNGSSSDGGFTNSFNLMLGISILLVFGLIVAYLIK